MTQEQSKILQNVWLLKKSADIMKTSRISAKMVRYRHIKKKEFVLETLNHSNLNHSSQDSMKNTP